MSAMGLFARIFGQLAWTPPAWAGRGGGRSMTVALLAIATLAALGVGLKHYLDNRIQPTEVVAQVSVPDLAVLANDALQPQPLLINFTVVSDPRAQRDDITSVAALDQIGETVTGGVSIKPAIDGQWRWLDDHTLQFLPDADWPADQNYTVTYDTSLFAPNLKLADTRAAFTTHPFSADIEQLEFYQDPAAPSQRNVVATLAFSHAVSADTLREHVQYTMSASDDNVTTDAQAVEATVRLDNTGRIAYVHSAPIDLPASETYMTLQVDKGLTPAEGPATLAQRQSDNVLIPDVGTYFKVRAADAVIARNADDDPVQTLTLSFTDRVRTDQLRGRLAAYLLPSTVTINGRREQNKYWRGPREVTAEVLRQAERVDLTLNPVDGQAANVHSARLDLPEDRYVYIKVSEGLTSEGEFVLSAAYDAVLRAPSYPKEASVAQEGAILPLTGSHRLTLVSRGVQTLKVEIARLLDSDVNHLASQSSGDITAPQFDHYNFNEDNLTTRVTRYIDVNAGHPSQAAYASLDMTDFLAQGGYYFVTVQGWDRANGYPIGQRDRRFVLITDIGLLVKVNADSSQEVFAHSIATGEPLAGARVSLLGKNGIPVMDASLDGTGHASLPVTQSLQREKTPTVYVVRNGSDTLFMPFSRYTRMMQYSRFDVGGDYVQARNNAQQLRAQIFTDRGIFRPGDTVNLGFIVKREDWGSLGNLPLAMRITDPRGRVVLDEKRRLPSDGFFDLPFATDASSATGNYQATLYLVESNRSQRPLGNVSFKVEEFLPDRMRIRATIPGQVNKGWIKPADMAVNVNLQNLFGSPAQSRRVTGVAQLVPSGIRMKQFADYRFDDPLRDQNNAVAQVREELADTTTDTQGNASLALNLARYDKGIYRLTVTAEGFEEGGGRSVKAQAGAMVSPLDYLIGYRTDSDLGFLTKDSRHTVSFVAIDSNGEAIALDKLTREVVEYRFVSTLVQRPNGTYAYQSVRKESPIAADDFSVATAGTDLVLPTDAAGAYAIRLRDGAGQVYAKVDFTVAGARNVAGNLERDAQLQLNLNGSSFAPGEEIELEITAPFSGVGLITIERERVYAHKWFQSVTNSTVQRIRVPADLEGNAYVNVAFVRDLGSPEVFVSPLSYAVAAFSINRAQRTLGVELDVPELVRPGRELEIGYQTTDDARVVIYAVDEGILQVAGYKIPAPLDFFLRKIALQVSTFQMVDLILPEFDAYVRRAAPGGGAAADRAGNNLNPFRRKTDVPVAYWSGIVKASKDRQTLRWRVPDSFSGQLRVMAIAVTDNAVGHAEASTLARGPFVLTPNVLTAAAPGDEFDVNVGVANQLEGSGPGTQITVSVSPSDELEIVGDASQDVTVDEGSEGRVRFRVRARDMLGAAKLAFEARGGDESVRLAATLSVRPSAAYTATMRSGSTSKDPFTAEFERTLYAAYAKQSVAASASPLVLADGMLDYLEAFPHACAEQMVSKVFPQIGFLESGDMAVDEQAVREAFASTINKLRARQTPDGGFRFWMSSQDAAAFPSIYIMHFLTDAAALGLPVPRAMQRSGVSWLEQFAGREVTTLADARVRAYAIYVLTRNAVVTTGYLANLHEYLERAHADVWQLDIVGSYMAASYQQLKQDALAEPLIQAYQFGGGDEMTSDFDTRLGRDAQHVYLLARHFPARLQRVEAKTIEDLVAPVLQNRFNTLSSAYTILALGEYTKAVFAQGNAALLTITSTDGEVLSDAARFARAGVAAAVRSLQVSGTAGGDMFYVLSQSGFDQKPPTTSLAQGLELDRVYLDADGNPVTDAQIGDELVVRLRVRSTGRARSNIAVVDLLPGGFEVIRDSVVRQFGGWQADYADVREDRVVFYGSFDDAVTEMRYRVKVTSAGVFTVPSAFANSMYDRSVQARTKSGQFDVAALP